MGYKWQPSAIRLEGLVAYVALTKGYEAKFDADDLHLISGKRWHATVGVHGHAYAVTYIDRKPTKMHRLIMADAKEPYIDHVNGDGLDNRRSNLRGCTHSQNHANRGSEGRNLLNLKGVSRSRGRYRARIEHEGKEIYIGSFATPQEASDAYFEAAKALWGDFARR